MITGNRDEVVGELADLDDQYKFGLEKIHKALMVPVRAEVKRKNAELRKKIAKRRDALTKFLAVLDSQPVVQPAKEPGDGK